VIAQLMMILAAMFARSLPAGYRTLGAVLFPGGRHDRQG
jgi:hypothetical protein